MKKTTIEIYGNNGPVIITGQNNTIYFKCNSSKKKPKVKKSKLFRIGKWIKGFFLILSTFFTSSCS